LATVSAGTVCHAPQDRPTGGEFSAGEDWQPLDETAIVDADVEREVA
jgi:hypothetical protein